MYASEIWNMTPSEYCRINIVRNNSALWHFI